jgi:hypothetical protein
MVFTVMLYFPLEYRQLLFQSKLSFVEGTIPVVYCILYCTVLLPRQNFLLFLLNARRYKLKIIYIGYDFLAGQINENSLSISLSKPEPHLVLQWINRIKIFTNLVAVFAPTPGPPLASCGSGSAKVQYTNP